MPLVLGALSYNSILLLETGLEISNQGNSVKTSVYLRQEGATRKRLTCSLTLYITFNKKNCVNWVID